MSKNNLFEDCIPKWIETLKNDPDGEKRKWEAISLGIWGSDSAVRPLCDAVVRDDESEKVKFEAIKALSKIYPRLNDKELKGKIIQALITAKLKPNPTKIRKHAEKVLKEIKNKFPNDFPN